MLARIPWGARIFALVWLAVALLPPLRECFTVYYSEFYGMRSFYSETPSPSSAGDLRAVSAQFSTKFFQSSDTDILKQWDDLAAQHPREVWLRADRLRATLSHGFFNSRLPEWATPEMFEQGIKCAREAQTIEPDNGFWLGIEASLNFKAGRFEEARSALRDVVKAKRWNSYSRDATRRKIALYERIRPLLYEEKLPLEIFPDNDYLSIMYQMRRGLTEQGLQLQSRGDEKGAFAVFSDVLGVGRFIHQHSDSRDDSFIGWAIERNVAFDVAKGQGVTIPPTALSNQTRTNVLATFSEVARRAGRADLAQDLQSDWEAEQRERTLVLKDRAKDVTGVSSNATRLGTQGTYMLVYVARLAFVGALLWIFGRLWTPLNIVVPTRGEIARSANFSFWSTIGLFALAWFWGVGGNVFSVYIGIAQSSDSLLMPRELAPVFFPVAAFLSWLLPVVWTTRNRQLPPPTRSTTVVQKRKKVAFRGTSSARLFLCVATVGFWLISLQRTPAIWGDTPFAYPVPQYALKFCVLALFCLEVVRWRNVETRPTLRPYIASAFAISIIVALALIFTSTSTFSAIAAGRPTLAMWLLPLLVVVGFALTFVTEQSKEIHPTRKLDFFIVGASRTAGVLAVVWSLFFLAGTGIIWPIRAQLNHQLDRQLALGERAWRAQLTE